MTKATAVAALLKAAHAIPHLLVPGETAEEWDDRVRMVVESDYESALRFADGKSWTAFELALADVVLQGNESGGFDRRVHAGEKHPRWTQDDGRARCLGQLHETKDRKGNPSGPVPRAVWERLAGLDQDATNLCAATTTAMLVSHAKECGVFLGRRASRGAVAQAFASYGSGGKCTPNDDMWKRAIQWENLMGRFGPKPDLPGHHRVPQGGVPEGVKRFAGEAIATLSAKDAIGMVLEVTADYGVEPQRWKVRLERHAEGKIGFSAFEKD